MGDILSFLLLFFFNGLPLIVIAVMSGMLMIVNFDMNGHFEFGKPCLWIEQIAVCFFCSTPAHFSIEFSHWKTKKTPPPINFILFFFLHACSRAALFLFWVLYEDIYPFILRAIASFDVDIKKKKEQASDNCYSCHCHSCPF